jgi:hypothetical protein
VSCNKMVAHLHQHRFAEFGNKDGRHVCQKHRSCNSPITFPSNASNSPITSTSKSSNSPSNASNSPITSPGILCVLHMIERLFHRAGHAWLLATGVIFTIYSFKI